jgi:hypothetical protein
MRNLIFMFFSRPNVAVEWLRLQLHVEETLVSTDVFTSFLQSFLSHPFHFIIQSLPFDALLPFQLKGVVK